MPASQSLPLGAWLNLSSNLTLSAESKPFATHLGDEILKAVSSDTDVLVSVTRDSRSRAIYVNLVNPGSAAAPVQLDVTGGTRPPARAALTLAGDPRDTNSIDSPERVVPKSSPVTGVRSGFTESPGKRHRGAANSGFKSV